MKLRQLKDLGPKSEKHLLEIGITTPEVLEKVGAVRAYIRLSKESRVKPSLNFLYAMVGALENQHWIDIANTEKGRLLMELEGFRELEEMLKEQTIEIKMSLLAESH